MAKEAAFLFYPEAYIGGTMHFTLEQHGAYLLLLILQYHNGPFTGNQAIAALGGNITIWNSVREKFVSDGLYNYNERLQKELERKLVVPFRAPRMIDVIHYFEELDLAHRSVAEADKFVNFYTSKGWKVGKVPMKDWKAACRNWKANMTTDDGRRTTANTSKAAKNLNNFDKIKEKYGV